MIRRGDPQLPVHSNWFSVTRMCADVTAYDERMTRTVWTSTAISFSDRRIIDNEHHKWQFGCISSAMRSYRASLHSQQPENINFNRRHGMHFCERFSTWIVHMLIIISSMHHITQPPQTTTPSLSSSLSASLLWPTFLPYMFQSSLLSCACWHPYIIY